MCGFLIFQSTFSSAISNLRPWLIPDNLAQLNQSVPLSTSCTSFTSTNIKSVHTNTQARLLCEFKIAVYISICWILICARACVCVQSEHFSSLVRDLMQGEKNRWMQNIMEIWFYSVYDRAPPVCLSYVCECHSFFCQVSLPGSVQTTDFCALHVHFRPPKGRV